MMNTNTTASSASGSGSASLAAFSGLPSVSEKDKDSQWYFTADELMNSPSRSQGIDSDTELSYRQMTAYLIQEMGQRLKVSQLCINTAIVYMHRFYAFHSFTHFHRNGIASASLFLAAKVEEQPRKLEHVIRAANKCLNQPTSNNTDAFFLEQAQDLVFNENVLLQTLGFDVAIDHPHTHVVKTCHLVKACKDLTKTSYFLASNSLHLTSMCLQYRPTVVACFCIYLACKWSRWEIPQSTEGKHWFHYVDKTVTMELLKQLTDEFIAIYEKSPARLKSKLNSIKALAQGAGNNRPVGKDKKVPADDWKMSDMLKMYHSSINISENSNHSGGGSEHQQQQHSPHMNIPPMLPPPPQQQQHAQTSSQHQQQMQQMQQTQPSLQQQQQQQQQQARKSDMHSSQHRSQSLHSKHSFPLVGDMTDHKSNYKNPQAVQQSQPGFTNQNAAVYSSSGRMREHSQGSQQQATLPPPSAPANQGSRSSMTVTSGSRGVSSSGGHQAGQSNMRQPVPPSGIQLDSHNYQKVRERSASIHSMPSNLHNTMPQHSSASHKMQSKGDAVSSSNRMQVPKESKHKIFGTSIPPPTGMREYSNTQAPSMTATSGISSGSGGGANKSDSTHDLSRGLMSQHGQRSFSNNNNNNQTIANPVLGNLAYNIPQSTQHRQTNTSSIATNSSTSISISGKMDHNKAISTTASSMHMQSQLHKSNIQSDASYTNTSAPAHDISISIYPNQQTQSQSHQFTSMMRSVGFENLLNEPSMYSSSNVLPLGQQSGHTQIKPSISATLFGSNETSDNKMSHNMSIPANNFGANNTSMETNGSHRSMPAIKTEVSPRGTQMNREKERERFKTSSPSSKKEKHRHAIAGTTSFGSGGDNNLQGQLSQQRSMQYLYKKTDTSGAHGNPDQLVGVNVQNLGAGMKRPMQGTIKHEDEGLRESKIHKLDSMSTSTSTSGSLHSDSKVGVVGELGKLGHVVNGIETNPDMVRNLLKESLCTSSALIKQENLLSAPDSKPPAELFATPYDKDDVCSSKINIDAPKPAIGMLDVQPIGTSSASIVGAEDSTEGKDREKHKKNKKEKHKHKEKDKSKDRDREERKKHKKDKDRHKEKERERDGTAHEQRVEGERPAESVEPFKIKIRKDILEGTTLNPPPFKIKIPKDRIIGDINLGGGCGGNTSNSSTSHHRTAIVGPATSATSLNAMPNTNVEQKPCNPTLKIKISKDKIESYTGGTYHQHSLSNPIGGLNTSSFSTSLEQPTISNTGFYASYFTPHNQSGANAGMSSGSGIHSHSHHSSGAGGSGAGGGGVGGGSSSGGSSSKKKDRDRDRNRDHDRERDKKRHCGESSRASIASLNNPGIAGNLVSGNSAQHSSSSSGNNSHSRTHSSNKH